jgi:outer membrane lipase/esterase
MSHRAPIKLLLLLLALLPPLGRSAHAGPSFSGLYVFGDSLSDSGNLFLATSGAIPPPSLGYAAGRFTNGPNYADDLAVRLGLALGPSLAGGSNFAWGGARAGTIGDGPPTGVPALLDQVGAFIAPPGPSADPGALYVVFAGGNDIRAALIQLAINQALVPAMLNEALLNIGTAIAELALEGAHDFLVPNLPDLSLIPGLAGNPLGQAAALSLVTAFNAGLDQILDGEPALLHITRFDTFGFLHGFIAAPPAGITDLTNACLVGGVACADPDSHLFWDDLHPTRVAHAALAEAQLMAVPEPGLFMLLCLAAIGLMLRTRGALG